MNTNSEFNFSNVKAAKGVDFLRPGYYKLSINNAEIIKPEGLNKEGFPKSAYLKISFEGAAGQMNDKFFITPKTLSRLQYLHEYWIGKELTKEFQNAEQVGAYFEKLFNDPKAKSIVRMVCVGGEQANDGKVYARLPYSNYILPDDTEIKERVFEEDSYSWNQFVKKQVANMSTSTNDTMISSNEKFPSDNNSSDDDLPF